MDKKQIKARFFGAHIGCDVNILLKGRVIRYATNCGVVAGARDSVLISVGELSKYSDEEFDIKLVLRPPTALKEHELAQLDAIAMKYRREKQLCGVLKFDYLRSINICVPFMGHDPIAEGWAILEEKIPANQPKNDFQAWLMNQGYTRAGHAWVMPNNDPASGAHLSEKLDEWKSNAPQETPQEEKI